jgi:hypothetical protein
MTSVVDQLAVCPVSFAEAARFVARHHRHHQPPVGHKFSIGVEAGGEMVGVAMIGRPVARHFDDGWTLEVTRTCTNGYRNANSMLYGAAWRATKALGYRRLITYTVASESGASLRAAGWRVVGQRAARPGWNHPQRPRVDKTAYDTVRTVWQVGERSDAARRVSHTCRCVVCGDGFDGRAGACYCGSACRQRAYRQRIRNGSLQLVGRGSQ